MSLATPIKSPKEVPLPPSSPDLKVKKKRPPLSFRTLTVTRVLAMKALVDGEKTYDMVTARTRTTRFAGVEVGMTTTCHLFPRLERAGYVTGRKDGRRRWWSLTEKARRELELLERIMGGGSGVSDAVAKRGSSPSP